MPEGTRIEMHEFRSRVIPHATEAQFERRLPNHFGMNTRNLQIDGLTLHMQTILSGPPTGSDQHGIILGRPEPGDNVDLAIASQCLLHQIHMLKHPHVDGCDLTGVMTTQDVIDIVERVEIVLSLLVSKGHIQPLISPDVKQCEPAGRKLTGKRHRGADQPTTQDGKPYERRA